MSLFEALSIFIIIGVILSGALHIILNIRDQRKRNDSRNRNSKR